MKFYMVVALAVSSLGTGAAIVNEITGRSPWNWCSSLCVVFTIYWAVRIYAEIKGAETK